MVLSIMVLSGGQKTPGCAHFWGTDFFVVVAPTGSIRNGLGNTALSAAEAG